MDLTVSPPGTQANEYAKRKNEPFGAQVSANYAAIFTRVGSSFAQLQSAPEKIQDAVQSELKTPNRVRIDEIAAEELQSPSERKADVRISANRADENVQRQLIREPQQEVQSEAGRNSKQKDQPLNHMMPKSDGPSKPPTPSQTNEIHAKTEISNWKSQNDGAARNVIAVQQGRKSVQGIAQLVSASKSGPPLVGVGQSNKLDGLKANDLKRTSVFRFSKQHVPTQVSRALAQIVTQGGGKTTLRLNPRLLGQVRIDVQLKQGIVNAQLHADHQQARELLKNNISTLRLALEKSGVTVERLEIIDSNTSTKRPDSAAEQQREGQFGEGFQRQSKQNMQASQNEAVGSSQSVAESLDSRQAIADRSGVLIRDGTGELRLDTVA